MTIKNKKTEGSTAVPCGKCPKCLARRTSAWSFRLIQQDKISISSLFITLTYDGSNLPVTKNGFMSLCKNDVQKFLKRLRKMQTSATLPGIKYFAVGEYGSKGKRPHYHIILFNAEADNIAKAWNKGEVHFGSVSGASVGYTLKYIQKGVWRPDHSRDDRAPQFQLMSKGLGANYINEKTVSWHTKDLVNRTYLTTEDNKKISMPRYYKDRIYSEEQRRAVAYHGKVKALANEEKAILEDPDYFRNKAEDDLYLFRKQLKNIKNSNDNEKI